MKTSASEMYEGIAGIQDMNTSRYINRKSTMIKQQYMFLLGVFNDSHITIIKFTQ